MGSRPGTSFLLGDTGHVAPGLTLPWDTGLVTQPSLLPVLPRLPGDWDTLSFLQARFPGFILRKKP